MAALAIWQVCSEGPLWVDCVSAAPTEPDIQANINWGIAGFEWLVRGLSN